MLSLRAIHKTYHTGGEPLHVLKGIDLEIGRGELVSIMGSSGSGKSTLLNILGLLDRHDDGDYRLDGDLVENLSEAASARLRNEKLGFVFQSFNLVTFKNAVENVALPLYYRGVPRKRRNQLAMEYLERVGLSDRAKHFPNQLSGGQQQRVAIARALISEPRVILADEPTGALDSHTSLEVMELLLDINRSGTTVVIVTHEHDIAEMTHRIVRLHDGLVAADQLTLAGGAEVAS
jgi:putative ABC transport system ATP-binding protein